MKLTLEKILKALNHVDTLEYWLPAFGIEVVHHIPFNGIAISDRDIVDIYQHKKLVKTMSTDEYNKLLAKSYTLETYFWGNENSIQQRWTKESRNEISKIIKELGCQGPEIEE